MTSYFKRQYNNSICQIELARKSRKVEFSKVINSRRPRKKFLYIGVMSTDKYLRTRGVAQLETWASHLPNKSVQLDYYADSAFFDRQQTNSRPKARAETSKISTSASFSVKKLPNVPDYTYPPQKKSFSMLQHISKNYIDKYDWFLRLDDDAYVNFEKLEQFLKSVDQVGKSLLIGQPGMGQDADDYIPPGFVYCMGGTGVIFSNQALRELSKHLRSCLKDNLFTTHEDIELGRCAFKHLNGLTCTKAWALTKLFYQNYADTRGDEEGRDRNLYQLNSRVLSQAIILHSNKDSEYQYKTHVGVAFLKVKSLTQSMNLNYNQVLKMDNYLSRIQVLEYAL